MWVGGLIAPGGCGQMTQEIGLWNLKTTLDVIKCKGLGIAGTGLLGQLDQSIILRLSKVGTCIIHVSGLCVCGGGDSILTSQI